MPAAAPIATRATAALAVVLGVSACNSSPTQSPSPSASAGTSRCSASGVYCVSVDVTGTLDGHLAAVSAPSGFAVVCRALTRPRDAWVTHVYSMLGGRLWHLVVETTAYTGPGTYNALLTFSVAQSATGTPTAAPEDSYAGQGTATVAAGGAAATITGTVHTADSTRTLNLSGSLSCQASSA